MKGVKSWGLAYKITYNLVFFVLLMYYSITLCNIFYTFVLNEKYF